MHLGIIDELNEAIERLLTNKPVEKGESPDDSNQLLVDQQGVDALWEKLIRLQAMHLELQQFSIGLSRGEMATKAPPRSNYLAAALKQLQMHLRHLSWQTQRISEGDYSQRVDFMGEFSEAFNKMIEQLETRENNILAQREMMLQVFDQIEPIFIVLENDHSHVLYANKMAKLRFQLEGDSEVKTDLLQRFSEQSELKVSKQIQDPHSSRWYRVSCERFFWEQELDSRLYHCVDITSHIQRESDLEHAAHTDKLTGLNNRYVFERSYDKLWETCRQNERPMSVIMFDIDFFKKCNDNYGHLHGDRCLVYFADVLRAKIGRFNDVIARFGGEEFVVLLPFTNQESAFKIAETVRAAVEAMVIPVDATDDKPPSSMQITTSGGLACIVPTFDAIQEELITAADKALYAAKQSGRNRICVAE